MITSFYIFSVEKGKNNNWLKFTASIPSLSHDKDYTLEFCGTEINHSLSLSSEIIESLQEKLIDDFNYGPYDIKKCKDIIKEGKHYQINSK